MITSPQRTRHRKGPPWQVIAVDGKDWTDEVMHGLLQELRRGTLVISVLSQLQAPQYGYSLVAMLADRGVEIDAGTLYPLLRRLEKQGLLTSHWDTDEARPRTTAIKIRNDRSMPAAMSAAAAASAIAAAKSATG